ncbi:MAG TPA: hypothetical protein ACHBY4_12545 [Arsenophonus apicola]|uniref:hypothetical protein n=1 Tax=Arsenophonus apicola TaxID=2879119 RepID=UPI003879D787
MSNFGCQVFLKDGANIETLVVPVFFLDFITNGNGEKTYTIPENRSIKVLHSNTFSDGSAKKTEADIKGNKITYRNTSEERPLLVIAE